MKHSPEVAEGNNQERSEVETRIKDAAAELRGGTTGKSYWQFRAILSKPEVLAALSKEEREALQEAADILERSPEIQAYNKISKLAGREEKNWP